MPGMVWSEQELSNAAKCVAESMLTSFPSPSECEHTFSDDFEHSMESLRRKSRRKVAAHKMWQRVAAILIVAILSVSTWLTVDVQARERVFKWFKEVYEDMTVYHFEGDEAGKARLEYDLTWLPKGFVLQERFVSGTQRCDIYINDVSDEVFLVECTFMDNTAMTITAHGDADPVIYDINEIPGEFYGADENSANQVLIWVDEDNAMVFTVQGNISEQDIVHIARGVILSKSTK